VLPGRGLCDKLITRPEESYRLWCVVVCDLENLVNEETLAHWGLFRPKKNHVTILVETCREGIPYLHDLHYHNMELTSAIQQNCS